MLQLPPLSLYIHAPWCVKKCPYCDFNSHKVNGRLPESEYVAAVISDLMEEQERAQGRPLHSIFIGGGTPSLLSGQAIGAMLEAAERHIGFDGEIEITLEANPGTAEQGKFHDFRQAGVNRLSIGVQSFSDLHLQQLGRIHGRAEALNALAMARNAGFDNVNLDLMHGLPGQSPADALEDLRIAVGLAPEHLSWYQLTIEPNTEFFSHPPRLPEDDALAEIQLQGEQFLSAHGFNQYEVSAYAQAGKVSDHNLNYWRFGDYFGIGAGAHGKITHAATDTISRRWKTRQPNHYLDTQRNFCAGEQVIAQEDRPLEYLMNCLRLKQGVAVEDFTRYTGMSMSSVADTIEALRQRKLIRDDRTRLQTTELGYRYLNEVLAEFM